MKRVPISSFASVFYCLFPILLAAQDSTKTTTNLPPPKIATALYVETAPKLDGLLDDSVWHLAPIMTDFTQFSPHPNTSPSQRTEVKVIYTTSNIYVGAKMYDASPDSILKQLCVRDDVWSNNADMFMISIDGMLTRQSAFQFGVTAANVQYDASNYDDVWDAVWKSKTRIVEDGWLVEMEIPYSQLRFPPSKEQTWGINFERTIRRKRELSCWAKLEPTLDNEVMQYGNLKGISNIKPPVRLSFTPYLATYLKYQDDNDPTTSNWKPTASAGADLKYGINESFTLDVALIPDFGDVQYDDLQFNLSPFEIYYAERRPFFTEGTELFGRGDLFYSRRVGGLPSRYDVPYKQLNNNEIVKLNPTISRLVNALKVSGRTKKKLGLGLFNAVTAPTFAQIRDTVTGETRRIMTNPFTNYNVMVIDQQFGNNSFISFTQTNVIRFGQFTDALALGTQFNFVDNKNRYGLSGSAAYSHLFLDSMLYGDQTFQNGYRYNLRFAKTSGNFRFSLGNSATSANFDINELGFVTATNFINNYATASYNVYKPFWIYNSIGASFSITNDMLYNPLKFSRIELAFNMSGTFRNFLSAGFDVAYQPWGYKDFYEARNNFQVWDKPQWGRVGAWFSSDYRKRFALDGNFSYRAFAAVDSTWKNADILQFNLAPRLRVNDQINFVVSNDITFRLNNLGFCTFDDNGTVIFGSRYRQDMINTISFNYLFTNLMSLSFNVRHYWSFVKYDKFYEVSEAGKLINTSYTGDHDRRYNAFNIDLIYRWRFAPGSELNVVWKNMVLDYNNHIETNYFTNFVAMYQTPGSQRQSFSIKCLYFLDYFKLHKKNKNTGKRLE